MAESRFAGDAPEDHRAGDAVATAEIHLAEHVARRLASREQTGDRASGPIQHASFGVDPAAVAGEDHDRRSDLDSEERRAVDGSEARPVLAELAVDAVPAVRVPAIEGPGEGRRLEAGARGQLLGRRSLVDAAR